MTSGQWLNFSIKLRDELLSRWWNVAGRLVLRMRGVSLGAGVSLYGWPVVSVAPGSSLAIGDRVVLCSVPRFTALGGAGPVVLRTLDAGARIDIGRDCGLSGTVICAMQQVSIGEECLFGADVRVMDTDFHPLAAEGRRFSSDPQQIASAPVHIGRNVFIGTGSMVLKGVRIGDNAVVGAGSVVTRDVPANTIAAGNPARIVGRVPVSGQRRA